MHNGFSPLPAGPIPSDRDAVVGELLLLRREEEEQADPEITLECIA